MIIQEFARTSKYILKANIKLKLKQFSQITFATKCMVLTYKRPRTQTAITKYPLTGYKLHLHMYTYITVQSDNVIFERQHNLRVDFEKRATQPQKFGIPVYS